VDADANAGSGTCCAADAGSGAGCVVDAKPGSGSNAHTHADCCSGADSASCAAVGGHWLVIIGGVERFAGIRQRIWIG
jgi:hypothetical protein